MHAHVAGRAGEMDTHYKKYDLVVGKHVVVMSRSSVKASTIEQFAGRIGGKG